MVDTSLGSSPQYISPVNNIYGSTFQLYNADYTATNFKYYIKLFVNNQYLLAESVPARPGTVPGYGYYSPFEALLPSLTYNLNQKITTAAIATNSICNYFINYGLSYNPNLQWNELGNYSGYFGAGFTASHGFKVGDLISIQSQNPFISGTTSIRSVFSATQCVFQKIFATTSYVSIGYISDLNRITGTSATFFGFNGTRQYDEAFNNSGVLFDFYQTYVTEGIYSTNSKFLTSFPANEYKSVGINDWETASNLVYNGVIPGWAGNNAVYRYILYDNTGTAFASYTYSIPMPTSTFSVNVLRIDLPTGPKNLALRGITMSNVAFYAVHWSQGSSGASASTPSSEVKFYKIENPCTKYTPVRIMYMNRYGAFDYWTFDLVDRKSYNTTRTEMKKELGFTYRVGDRERTNISVGVVEQHQINTNWISESNYAYLSELHTSPEVYVIADNGDAYPIIVKDTQFQFKTHKVDKLISYQMVYETSYTIQTINQ